MHCTETTPTMTTRSISDRSSWTAAAEGKARSSLNALRHGIYADRFLDENEPQVFGDLMARLRQDFDLEEGSNLAEAEALAMAYIQFCRAITAGDAAAAQRFSRAVAAHTKRFRGVRPKVRRSSGQRKMLSPAEWATALLEEVEAGRAKGSRRMTGRR